MTAGTAPTLDGTPPPQAALTGNGVGVYLYMPIPDRHPGDSHPGGRPGWHSSGNDQPGPGTRAPQPVKAAPA